MLGRLKDLDQAGAFERDLANIVVQDVAGPDGGGGGLDVVDFNGLDDFDVAFGAGNFGFFGSSEESVVGLVLR